MSQFVLANMIAKILLYVSIFALIPIFGESISSFSEGFFHNSLTTKTPPKRLIVPASSWLQKWNQKKKPLKTTTDSELKFQKKSIKNQFKNTTKNVNLFGLKFYTFFHILGHNPNPKRACGCTNTQNHQHYDPEMIRKLLKGLLRSKKSSIPISNYSTSHEFSEENVPTTQKIFVRNVVEDLVEVPHQIQTQKSSIFYRVTSFSEIV